jgi:ABC-type amino acid transport substrate-binding protein
MFWLPEERFPRFSMALGLWKGDQTLKRAVNDAIADIDSSGDMAGFAAKYGL